MDTDDHSEYRVETHQEGFVILNSTGRAILSFRDMNSASQYASLLNEAFKVGYKRGYRDARMT